MRTCWSAFTFTLLMTLVGCGAEQFGTVPKSQTQTANPLQTFEQMSCSSFTLIKPKVDILYVVDNSSSTYYLQSDIRNAIKSTVNSISSEFDYRVIGTKLISTDNADYQVMTNSSDLQGIPGDARRIGTSGEFNFFSSMSSGAERGLQRTYDFINANRLSGLFRTQAHLVVVLISNGRDTDIEYNPGFGSNEVQVNAANYADRLSKFRSVRTALQSQQLRFFSITAKTACQSGWMTSLNSYVKMSKDMYVDSAATDSSTQDSYDLCPQAGGLANVYTGINSSIRQIVLPHSYRYWPITFAENNETVALSEIRVYKVTGNSAPVEIPNTAWSYYDNGSNPPLNTRELPTAGEPVAGRHFVRFNNGSLITYPDCVMVRSVSRTEYFGFVVLPQPPRPDTILLRINGNVIPQSTTNGWSLISGSSTRNIKVGYPNPGDENPPLVKTGFMLQLNGSSNYYKSGDSVEVYYLPAGI